MRQTDSASPAQTPWDQHPVKTRFRPDIEGLRAVAVLAVVLFHADVPGARGGYVGVDVFFVISGFLITGLLWREASSAGTVQLRRFYGARARRLLPASATVGAITMIAAAILLAPLQVRPVIYDGIASATYVSNMWFLARNADYFSSLDTPSPFLHYWSLAVEEQFYLVWPVLIIGTALLTRRIGRRAKPKTALSLRSYAVALSAIAVVSFLVSLALTHAFPPSAFFSMPTRAWQLASGGLVALTAGHWSRLPRRAAMIIGWTGLALILLACTRYSPTTLYPGTAALLPTLGTALVIAVGCALPAQGCGRFMAMQPMRVIGQISYSWYLWHWPVLILTPALLDRPLGLTGRLVAVLVSACLAVLTLRFVENPLRFAERVRRSALVSLALGGTSTLAAVCVAAALLVWNSTPVGRGPAAATPAFTVATPPAGSNSEAYDTAVRHLFGQVQAAVAASADIKDIPSNLTPPLASAADEQKTMVRNSCMRKSFEVTQPECATGDTTSATRIALVGDSNAAMWMPAFQRLATERHWRLDTLTKAACPLLDVQVFNPRLRRQYTECGQWRSQVVARLQAERPRLIVLSMSRRYGLHDGSEAGSKSYDPSWINGITRVVRELQRTGATVLVLGPIPDPDISVPTCLSAHLDEATMCAPLRSAAVNESGVDAENAATKAGGGHYIDLTELFCTTIRCPGFVGNTLVYIDADHLTLEYSGLLGPVMGALTDRTLTHDR